MQARVMRQMENGVFENGDQAGPAAAAPKADEPDKTDASIQELLGHQQVADSQANDFRYL